MGEREKLSTVGSSMRGRSADKEKVAVALQLFAKVGGGRVIGLEG